MVLSIFWHTVQSVIKTVYRLQIFKGGVHGLYFMPWNAQGFWNLMVWYLVFCLASAGDKNHYVSILQLLKIFGFTISVFHMVHCVAVGDVVTTSYMRFLDSKSIQENCSRVFSDPSSAACSVSGHIAVMLPVFCLGSGPYVHTAAFLYDYHRHLHHCARIFNWESFCVSLKAAVWDLVKK